MKKLIFIPLFICIACACFGQNKVLDKNQYNPADTILPGDTAVLNNCDAPSLPDHFHNHERLNLYDKDKKLSKTGYFENGKLWIGFYYNYSDGDDVIRIEKIFKGKKIGECEIRVKE